MLSSGQTEACRHEISVFCTKQHEQLSALELIVNLFGEQTPEDSSDVLHKFVRHCPRTPCGVAAMLSQDASSLFHMLDSKHHISVNLCYLVRAHLIKLATNIGVGFQLCQPQKDIHFPPHGKHLNWNKWDGTELSNATRLRLENDLEQVWKMRG
jgi:hypothetical protein